MLHLTQLRPHILSARTTRSIVARPFSLTPRVMSAGDTGSPPKTGGPGDAFQRREQASENLAIHEREREKLLQLKKKLQDQQEQIKKLSQDIDELTGADKK